MYLKVEYFFLKFILHEHLVAGKLNLNNEIKANTKQNLLPLQSFIIYIHIAYTRCI